MKETADSEIRLLRSDDEVRFCARLMSETAPWATLGRSYEGSRSIFTDPLKEAYGVFEGEELIGFLILDMNGPFPGFIQSVCVVPSRRGTGVGTRLMGFAEDRIFRVSPNAFLCVSDFNTRARDLYLRLGYEVVGKLENYVVDGHFEYLMRKTIGPLKGFRPCPE